MAKRGRKKKNPEVNPEMNSEINSEMNPETKVNSETEASELSEISNNIPKKTYPVIPFRITGPDDPFKDSPTYNTESETVLYHTAHENYCILYAGELWSKSLVRRLLEKHPTEIFIMMQDEDGTIQVKLPKAVIRRINWPRKRSKRDSKSEEEFEETEELETEESETEDFKEALKEVKRFEEMESEN